jgi:4-hydroxyphenylpyruvate dioxygenase
MVQTLRIRSLGAYNKTLQNKALGLVVRLPSWHAPQMSKNVESKGVGIVGYDSFHFVVENIERSKSFYCDRLDFKEIARASDAFVTRSGQQSVVFGAGDVRVCVSTALTQTSKAGRYLRRHPAGIMSLGFRVENLDRTIEVLESRGGTFLADPMLHTDEHGGTYRSVEIATPLGDLAFRFVERKNYRGFAPDFVDVGAGHASQPANAYGIAAIDHITSNGLTMQPIIAWYREVLGFEPFWDISFHTHDVASTRASGSGLRSIVMWDPESGVKFATNEPLKPFYRDSQIAKFVDDNQGPGVQHIAFAVSNIIYSVEELRRRGVEFLATPKSYYNDLPERLAKLGITNVREELKELERLQILLDGADDKYMLQIFMREAAVLYEEHRAGPFFYEIIQRAGDPGFGYGNFRALFESIERAQKTEAAVKA